MVVVRPAMGGSQTGHTRWLDRPKIVSVNFWNRPKIMCVGR